MKKTVHGYIAICSLFFSFTFKAQNAAATSFEFAKQVGGNGEDEGLSIALDQAGNLYSTGTFSGTVDFDPSPNVSNLVSAGGSDIFVSKLDASGNFIWAKAMGGPGNDIAYSITLDASGNIYSSGWFSVISDFNPGTGVHNLSSNGGDDIYISKLDNSGNFVWAESVGGSMSDQGVDVKVGQTGDVYLTGIFSDTVDFDPGTGTAQYISKGGFDIFLLKLHSNGSLDWVVQQGGIYDDDATSLVMDLAGDLFLCTSFRDTVDFDPGPGITDRPSKGGDDIAITKFNASGNFIWTKNAGGVLNEKPLATHIDGSGNIILTGYFQGTSDFDPSSGVSNLTSVGSDDIFILKLDSGGQFIWAKNIGGNGDDYGNAVATDASGNICVTGFFSGTIVFPTASGNYNLTNAGYLDIYIAILDASGNFKWATGFGSAIFEGGRDVVVNKAGEIIIIGGFGGTIDFDPGSSFFNMTSKGASDVFYYKMHQASTGIYEVFNSNDFTLYPNPTSGLIHIKSLSNENILIEIYSSMGELVQRQKINSDESISLNNLTSGIYEIKLILKNNTFISRKIQVVN